ncbi:hypothetical protein [Halalkalibacterium halodurans]|uniref:hypothetical protein n=1 Tax=Halalkalibacterium halodurans TaxID=86665 RepID=UPI002AA9E1C3|nr:hypothetical protein [Halalkalibacterium halodurans]MDY7224647.1 hypothetical protein [Halalkalibacterium halodurans]MDY7243246.1 hypothetical protein [Halalkalibacterium halodurans]
MWSEVLSFAAGLLVMFLFESIGGYVKGYSEELGRKKGRSKKSKRDKEKEKIYEYIQQVDRVVATGNVKENVFNNKKTTEYVWVLLNELKDENKIRKVDLDQQTKETTMWRYIR